MTKRRNTATWPSRVTGEGQEGGRVGRRWGGPARPSDPAWVLWHATCAPLKTILRIEPSNHVHLAF